MISSAAQFQITALKGALEGKGAVDAGSKVALPGPLRTETPAPPSSAHGAVEFLGEIAREWHASETALRDRLKGLPSQLRDLHTMQISVNKLQLYSEFISRAAEAASSVVRRVQQSGGS